MVGAQKWIAIKTGIPVLSDFNFTNGQGTPIVIDLATSLAYYVNANVVTAISASASVPDPIVPADGTQNITGNLVASGNITGANLSGTNTGNQTSIVGITGSLAEFNAALTGADFATGGGTVTGASSGTNTGDQTSIVGISGTKAQFDTACSDGDFQFTDTQLTSLAALNYAGNSLKVVRVNAGETDFELATISGGSTPTGTGFRHVTAGVEDAASKLVDTADINNDQVTYAKIQNVSAASRLLGRGSAGGSGDTQEISIGKALLMSGTDLRANPTVIRLATSQAASWLLTVNSTVYLAIAGWTFRIDFDDVVFNEYRIIANGSSNAAGQTITLQLATFTAPTTPIHTGGNDVVLTNTSGAFDSGWLSRDDGVTSGEKNYTVCYKGSNATVDLNVYSIEIWYR